MKLEGASGASWQRINTPTSGYEWTLAQTYTGLAAGTYTLKIQKREDGTKIDRIFVTSDGSTPQ